MKFGDYFTGTQRSSCPLPSVISHLPSVICHLLFPLTFQKFKSIFTDTWALSLTIKESAMMEVHRQSGGFTPPVVAKRTSRYRGSVAPGDGTGGGQDDRTGVE